MSGAGWAWSALGLPGGLQAWYAQAQHHRTRARFPGTRCGCKQVRPGWAWFGLQACNRPLGLKACPYVVGRLAGLSVCGGVEVAAGGGKGVKETATRPAPRDTTKRQLSHVRNVHRNRRSHDTQFPVTAMTQTDLSLTPALHLPLRHSTVRPLLPLGGAVTVTRTERILALYREQVRQTGSYIVARQVVMQRFSLPAAQADRILGRAR